MQDTETSGSRKRSQSLFHNKPIFQRLMSKTRTVNSSVKQSIFVSSVGTMNIIQMNDHLTFISVFQLYCKHKFKGGLNECDTAGVFETNNSTLSVQRAEQNHTFAARMEFESLVLRSFSLPVRH